MRTSQLGGSPRVPCVSRESACPNVCIPQEEVEQPTSHVHLSRVCNFVRGLLVSCVVDCSFGVSMVLADGTPFLSRSEKKKQNMNYPQFSYWPTLPLHSARPNFLGRWETSTRVRKLQIFSRRPAVLLLACLCDFGCLTCCEGFLEPLHMSYYHTCVGM